MVALRSPAVPALARSSLLLLLGTAGCFYTEEINQRPGLQMVLPGTTLVRGGTARFTARSEDPEQDFVRLDWRAYACADEESLASCDAVPFLAGTDTSFDVTIAPVLADGLTPTTHLRVTLDGVDARGAGAKPPDQAVLPVDNAPPSLLISEPFSAHAFTVGTPFQLYAELGDADDGADAVTLAFEVFAPTEVPFAPATMIDPALVPAPIDPAHRQAGIEVVPTTAGVWQVRIVATDPLGVTTEVTKPVAIVVDQPPCIAGAGVPTAPAPVFEPTVYAVTVDDALDPYPMVATPVPDIDGEARLQWSLKVGAGPRLLVDDATTNRYGFDPAAYPAGTQVELRVEVADRVARPVTCADANAECAVDGNAQCTQRRTWRLEAR